MLTFTRVGKQSVKRWGVLVAAAIFVAILSGSICPATAQTDIAKTRGSAAAAAGQSDVSKTPSGGALPGAAVPDAAVDGETAAVSAQVRRDGPRTVFELTTTRPVVPQIFVLSQPDRIVIDVPGMAFRLPPTVGQTGTGLISGFRYGIVAAGRARIVIDATQSVRVAKSGAVPGQPGRLAVELEAVAAEWAPAVLPAAVLPNVAAAAEKLEVTGARKPNGKFVVMIDPGHGGIDGGAMSATHVIEKDVTLAVARQLKAALEMRPGYDVRLTRSADTFVSLDARVELSQAAGADLFISIHADSVGDTTLARTARGATVYTLSETASNQAAQQFADKENAADLAGGLGSTDRVDATQVNSILTDLVKRETHNFSLQFRSLLIDRLRPANILARDPSRAAAFKVLRQLQTPTVLLELGFLTHEMDAQQMQSVDWQKRIAGAIATAVDSYAAKRAKPQR